MLRSIVLLILVVGGDSNSPIGDIDSSSIAGFCCVLLFPQLRAR